MYWVIHYVQGDTLGTGLSIRDKVTHDEQSYPLGSGLSIMYRVIHCVHNTLQVYPLETVLPTRLKVTY